MSRLPAKLLRAGAAVVLVAAFSATSAGAATTKARACKTGVAVAINGKRQCLATAKAVGAAPGTDLVNMVIRSSADPRLWLRSAYPSMYKALGSKSGGLLAFERDLYATSRAVGKPLVPEDPTQPANAARPAGGEETLGLNITNTPFELVIQQAERVQGGTEAPSGVQTREAVTTGTLKPPGGAAGQYTVQVKEAFVGDPCPAAGGVVTGKATYDVVREASGLTALYKDVENVVSVKVSFSGVVAKNAQLDHYKMDVAVSSEGGWRGEIHSKPTLKSGGVLRREEVGNFTVTAPTGLDAKGDQELASAIYQSIRLAKEQSDAWLKSAQKIWRDKAECKKVTGAGGALKPGEERVVDVTIKSIRGARADETVKLQGENGLKVVSPTGKATAKNGKVKVKVRAPSQRYLTRRGAGGAYALHVEGVSELGRGVGTVAFRQPLALFDVTAHMVTVGSSPQCSGTWEDVTFVGSISEADPTDPGTGRGTGTYAEKAGECTGQVQAGTATFGGGYSSDRSHIVIGWIAQNPFLLMISDVGELVLPQNGTTVVDGGTVTGYFNTTTTYTITITNLHDG
jgi:hypothetical protein